MFQDILTAIPLGIVLAFLLGPAFFLLLETAAVKGIRAAVSFDVGVILADVVFILIAYFSTNKLLDRIKDEPALFVLGGGLLIAYGLISFFLIQKKRSQEQVECFQTLKKGDYLSLFIKGFLLNFINIGVLGFWLGVVIAFSPTMNMDPQRITVFFLSLLLTYFIVDLGKIVLAKRLKDKLSSHRIFSIKRVISVLIFGCGALLIIKGVFPNRVEKIQNRVEHFIPDSSSKQILFHKELTEDSKERRRRDSNHS